MLKKLNLESMNIDENDLNWDRREMSFKTFNVVDELLAIRDTSRHLFVKCVAGYNFYSNICFVSLKKYWNLAIS